MSSPLERTQTRLHDTRSSNRTSHRNKITSNSGVEASRMREETAKRREDRLRNYDAVGREIIRVLTGNDPDSIGEVSPNELLRVLDYIRLMKSSVEIFQTINEALQQRIDELQHLAERDVQILHSVHRYLQTLPVLHAVRDARTDKVNFQVDFHSNHTIQVSASEGIPFETRGHEERHQKGNWFRNVVTAVAWVAIGASVAKSRFFKRKGNA